MGRLRLKSVPFSILKNMKTQGYLSNKVYLKKMVALLSPFKHVEQTDLMACSSRSGHGGLSIA